MNKKIILLITVTAVILIALFLAWSFQCCAIASSCGEKTKCMILCQADNKSDEVCEIECEDKLKWDEACKECEGEFGFNGCNCGFPRGEVNKCIDQKLGNS